jgi:hypothetical protein
VPEHGGVRKDYRLLLCISYGGAGKSLARPERKEATETEDFEFHTSYL